MRKSLYREQWLKIFIFQNYKHWYLNHTCSEKAFQGTVVNRALSSLHWGLLEIKLTVPLTAKIGKQSVYYLQI